MNHTTPIKCNKNNSIDTKEKHKKVHSKMKSHKHLMNNTTHTKENTVRSDINNNRSNRILITLKNNVKHNTYNGNSDGIDGDKLGNPMVCSKNQAHVNEHSNHDSSMIVKKFQKDRKSIR